MPQASVWLHMPRHMADADGSSLPKFYQLLAVGLRERGALVQITRRDKAALAEGAAGPGFHFVHNGAARGPCVLNCAIAYMNPYFYADPQGIYFESSLNGAAFAASTVPTGTESAFFQALQERHVLPRTSRYKQPEPVTDFPEGAISIFLQDWSEPVARARHLDAHQMVETVIAGAQGRPVIVKPHPRNRGEETALLLHHLARKRPGVIVSEANLHDILRRSAVCVTISSSVALEAMLHRVPVVLFGRSDLHHCAETVTQPQDWPGAMDRALTTDWPFESFAHWFLTRQLRTGPDMIPAVLDRMQAAGADLAALGLVRPPSPPARQ